MMNDLQHVRRALVLAAHPDDCEFFAGGLVTRLCRNGAEVTEVIATDGSRGSFDPGENVSLAATRQREARNAADIIGKHEVVFLGYPDGFLDDVPKNELRGVFMEHIRRVKPDLLLTFDPAARFEFHPDHRRVAFAAHEAVSFAAMPGYYPEHRTRGLLPHMTPLRYFFGRNQDIAETAVDIGDTLDTKIKAIMAHASQVRTMMQDFSAIIDATGEGKAFAHLANPDNPGPGIDMLIRAWASATGEPHGCCAEVFRRESVADIFNLGG